MKAGWIKLHREIIEWEWYTDSNTFRFFVYCLLRVNHKGNKWRGIDIPRGSFISSYGNMSKECRLSVQSIRTCVKRLKSTNDITYTGTTQHSVITVVEWDKYQSSTDEPTSDQQAINKRSTTNKNDKNEKNIIAQDRKPRSCVKGCLEILNDSMYQDLFENISHKAQKGWIEIYIDVKWVKQELKKATSWMNENPGRSPRSNFSRFYGSWLSRGWEKYRKTNKPSIEDTRHDIARKFKSLNK